MHSIHSRRRRELSDHMCVETLAQWLAESLTHEELAREMEEIFLERGPALPDRMRLDLKYFLADRPTDILAECLAMNERIDERAEFVEWCRELAAQGGDSHERFGVRRSDFHADRGSSRER